jgi:error-prone DNA polymerase
MYAELHALTNFSFLRAASFPGEMVAQAFALGYSALAITDECSVAGVVRAHEEAVKHGLPLIIGSELRCSDGLQVVVLATTRRGYGLLSQLITRARRAAPKGQYRISRNELAGALDDCLLLWLPNLDSCVEPCPEEGAWLCEHFPGRAWIGVELHHGGDDRGRLQQLQQLGARLGLPLIACGGALMHVPERKPLHDVMTAIRLGQPLAECGYALQSNSSRHLRTLADLAACYPPALLHASALLAKRCAFSLNELRYEYPRELVPAGETPTSWLRKLTYEGAATRWPQGVPEKVRHLLEHELGLIAELHYDPFFLTVQDLVRKAEELEILCQGRGSAANSAVCYCLGVTAVDPSRQEVLFERFISKERNEPPDIDLDFEHERREEIIQYVYKKYGRHRAGIAATVITYRLRSAVRDVGKALGLDVLQIERLITTLSRRAGLGSEQLPQWLAEAGFDPDSRVVQHLIERVVELVGFPRHLSQHVGGFVIAAELLEDLVPVENATMEGRTVIQWDKDDLEALGLLKVDVLALGMLTALRRALVFHNRCTGANLTLHSIPAEDPATYAMIQRADTIGVFQIESRAQMSMLPRLKPKKFYDLVIEVAIVRPGPIQGDMVHPYLRRRDGLEAVDYPSEAVRSVLLRTLGVPIFQEQVMQLAVVAAGFTPGEADKLRRAMAAWKRHGDLEPFRIKLMQGLRERGYEQAFADRLFRQIQGFSEYGFPESHAASFALLAYASSWLKCHAPAAFTAALINSQPMGFYAPAQLVRDAREHGVEVRPVDVLASDWDCTLEGEVRRSPVLRLGLRLVKGLSQAGAQRLMAARSSGPFIDAQDLAHRAELSSKDLAALGAANALQRLSGNRHQAAWVLAGVDTELPLLAQAAAQEGTPLLRVPTEGQNVTSDYQSVGLTLGRHPLALLRERFVKRELLTAAQLRNLANGAGVGTIGLVLLRQSPGTAKNTTFITLEDETGQLNLIVWAGTAQKYRRPFLEAQLLEIHGTLQHHSDVMHVVVEQMVDRTTWLGALRVNSRDFR